MKRFLLQIIAGILGIWISTKLVPGVFLEIIPGQSQFFGIELTENWQILILVGLVLGLINFFLKPVLKMISWPLRILTLGLFNLVINMLIIWLVDILFREFEIEGLIPLFWTTFIISLLNLFFGLSKLK